MLRSTSSFYKCFWPSVRTGRIIVRYIIAASCHVDQHGLVIFFQGVPDNHRYLVHPVPHPFIRKPSSRLGALAVRVELDAVSGAKEHKESIGDGSA
jgi:hypothetical protein